MYKRQYIISTKTHNLLKIGYSSKDPEERANELNDTSSPHPHVVDYMVLVDGPYQLEQRVHEKLSEKREGKEWFHCSYEEAVSTIQELAKDSILYQETVREIVAESHNVSEQWKKEQDIWREKYKAEKMSRRNTLVEVKSTKRK